MVDLLELVYWGIFPSGEVGREGGEGRSACGNVLQIIENQRDKVVDPLLNRLSLITFRDLTPDLLRVAAVAVAGLATAVDV